MLDFLKSLIAIILKFVDQILDKELADEEFYSELNGAVNDLIGTTTVA